MLLLLVSCATLVPPEPDCADCGPCGIVGGPYADGWIAGHPGLAPGGDPAVALDWTPPGECADVVERQGLLTWDRAAGLVSWDVGEGEGFAEGGGTDLGVAYRWDVDGVDVSWEWTDHSMAFLWTGPEGEEAWICLGEGPSVECAPG